MDQGTENGYKITIPLLVSGDDNNHQKRSEADEANTLKPEGRTSGFGTTFCKTFFNGLNALSGVGILSVPYALSSGGWLSLIPLLIIASSALYTGLLIQRCMDTDSTIITYPDIGDRAFGATGRIFVSIIMNTELYLVATSFLILEGDNLSNLFPNMEFELGVFSVGARQSFVIMVGLITLPTVWLNNMGILSFVSASGVAASFVLLGSIFWTGVFDGIGFLEKGKLLDWSGIPTAVSLYSFCYCSHPVFPTLYTSMRNQKQFSKVLALCFFASTFTYASVAVLGYLMFGSNVLSQITLNLPTSKISSRVAIYTTLVNPVAKYALIIRPTVDAIENRLLSGYNSRSLRLLIRTGLVCSTVFVALAVPFFGYLMSLVGACLSITGSIVIPCLCFLKITQIYRGLGFELLIILGIVLMSFAIMITGTYTSLLQIMRHIVR